MKRLTTAFLACFTAFYAWAQGAQGEGTALLDDLDSKDRVVVDAFANASNKIHSLIQTVSPKPEMDGYLKSTNFDTSMQASSEPYLQFKGRFGSTGSDISIPLRVIKNHELINYGFTSNTFGIVDVSAEQVVDVARKLGEGAWWSNVMTAIDVSYEEVGVYEWEEEVNVDTDGDGMEDSTEYVTRYDFVTNEVFVGTFAIDLRKWVLDALAKHSPTNLHPDSVKFLNQPERYDVYVSDSFGSDSNFNGRTPFTPFRSIQHAIDYSKSNEIYSICVAGGEYAFPQGYGGSRSHDIISVPRLLKFVSTDGAEHTLISRRKAVEEFGEDKAITSLFGWGSNMTNLIFKGFTFHGFKHDTSVVGNSDDQFGIMSLYDCVFSDMEFGTAMNYVKGCFGNLICNRCKFHLRGRLDGYRIPLRAAHFFFHSRFTDCEIYVGEDDIIGGGDAWRSIGIACGMENCKVICESDAITALFTNTYSGYPRMGIYDSVCLFKGALLPNATDKDYILNLLVGSADGGNIKSPMPTAKESALVSYDVVSNFLVDGGTTVESSQAFGYGDQIRSSVRIWLNSLPVMQFGNLIVKDESSPSKMILLTGEDGTLKIYEVQSTPVMSARGVVPAAAMGLLSIESTPAINMGEKPEISYTKIPYYEGDL